MSSAKPREYKFIKKIGSGACGEVFLAIVRRKKVAVKRVFRSLFSDDAFTDFMKEVFFFFSFSFFFFFFHFLFF